MQATDVRDVVRDYLDAFGARDLDRCVSLFGENGVLHFPPTTYQGKKALEDWHRARFDANLQIVRVDEVCADGATVTVDGVITSKRLKTWRIGNLSGRATFQIQDGKIVDARFSPRTDNLLGIFR